jgi:hypothetical protein
MLVCSLGNYTRPNLHRFSEVEGIDFDEIFAPVARLEPIQILMGIACNLGFKIKQKDVNNAFLNGLSFKKKSRATKGLQGSSPFGSCIQVEESLVWIDLSTKNMA